jgi:SAM-dependent methyltransferase
MTSSTGAVGRPEAGAGRNFGRFADLYDRRRPGYPGALIEALFDYCRAAPGDAALEIGAGTGQATRAVAARGVRVTAIEPSPELAEIADRNFAIAGLSAETVVTTFEEAVLPEAAYRLIYAATSWHWLDPATRFGRAEYAIAPDGTLAVLWTWPRWRATELRPQLDAVYENSGAPLAEMGPMYQGEPDPGALAREWSREIERSTVFGEPTGTVARWSVNYGSRAYADLLGTYGDHIALEPAIRDRLLDGIGAVVEAAGGMIALEYVTLLLMARAVGR